MFVQQDGSIHRFYAVPRAGTFSEVREELGPFGSAGFYSQLSPFAALLNVLRSLSVWEQGLQCDSFDPKSSPRLFDALQEARILEAEQITETITSIHSLLMLLLVKFWGDRPTDGGSETKRKGGSANQGRKDGSGGGGKDGGKDGKKLEKFGFDNGLVFYGQDRGGGNSGGTGAVDASESLLSSSSPSMDKGLPSSSSPYSDVPEEPREGAEIFLATNKSVSSAWNNDSVMGFSALEPDFHDPLNGLSPAQRIVEEWRQANPPPALAAKSTTPLSAPYACSFASLTTITPTLPLSKHLSPGLSPGTNQNPLSKYTARRKWVSKTPTASAKTWADMLRIVGQLNIH